MQCPRPVHMEGRQASRTSTAKLFVVTLLASFLVPMAVLILGMLRLGAFWIGRFSQPES